MTTHSLRNIIAEKFILTFGTDGVTSVSPLPLGEGDTFVLQYHGYPPNINSYFNE